ncbi:hypothetical protein A3464_06840 [Enterobacter genomosp. O]|uniref:hypothetical protein n=1 Tax=Enterobacter TaxID=547 RepID=UPI0007B32273|nr:MULTISPECIES: hypothetical protein [Enterobacter]KZQ36098.1 hypothetical protein A3464_06840 [Enterobacter genomosp. O]
MIDNKNVKIYPPSFSCLEFTVTGKQYISLKKKLKKEDLRSLIEKYSTMELDILTCMVNNIKKDTLVKYRVLKTINIRCDRLVIEKLISYESILMKSKEEVLKCFLFTVFMMYDYSSESSIKSVTE